MSRAHSPWRRDPLVRAIAALEPSPARSALAVLTGTAALGCAVGLMATSGWLISRAAQQPPVLYLQMAVVATRAFGIGRGVLRYAERLVSHDVALRGAVRLRTRLYHALAQADPGETARLRRGEVLARVGQDVDAVSDVLVRSILPFAVAWTTLLGTTMLVAIVLPPAGLVVAVAFCIAAVLAPWLAWRAVGAQQDDVAWLQGERSAQIHNLLEHADELRVAGRREGALAAVADADAHLAQRIESVAVRTGSAIGTATAATGAAMLGSLILGLLATSAGQLNGVLLAVITLAPLAAAEAVAALPAAASGLARSRAAAQRVTALLDLAETSTARYDEKGRELPDDVPAGIQARGLACGWPQANAQRAERPVLSGIDLDLPPGRRVGVVGPSGCGKTTLARTLAGLLDPLAGTVRIDGVEPVALQARQRADLVHLSTEDAHIFTTTVRENLRVADPRACDEALYAVLEQARLGPWVRSLPHGLDTVLTHSSAGGSTISGGERRRLILARALLIGAPVLILDEPAEHLDTQTADALMRDVFAQATEGRHTVLVITHRLVGLQDAEEVLLLGDGTIRDRGTHAELMQRHPWYADAVYSQESAVEQQSDE